MKFLLCSIALSFSVLVNAASVHPNVVPSQVTLEFFVNKNKNFCLGAVSNDDGAAVVTVPCGSGSSGNTFWEVPNGGPGTGPLIVFGDKCLDVTNGVNKDGTKLQIFTCGNGNKNQQWTVSNDLTIKWAGTNKCLDNTGGALVAAGNPTQIWTCGANNVNQKWLPDSFDPTGVAPGGEAFFLIPRKITSDFGCLTADSDTDGAHVVFQACDISLNNQRWTLTAGAPPGTEPVKGGVGQLRVFANKCLDVPSGNTANGVKLQVWTCGTGNPNQKFGVNGDGTIEWSGKNKCVDLTNGVPDDGNLVQSWTCSSTNKNQIWFVSPE